VTTKIKSGDFKYNKEATYSIPVFTDNEGNEKYKLLVTFPHKKSSCCLN
jgi:two-component system phosphate regulon sensor histidine kinase PhoR